MKDTTTQKAISDANDALHEFSRVVFNEWLITARKLNLITKEQYAQHRKIKKLKRSDVLFIDPTKEDV